MENTGRNDKNGADAGKTVWFDPAEAVAQLEREEEKELKRAKRKTLVQALKYAVCTASAGLIQFVSFAILQRVIKDNIGTIHFIVEDMSLATFLATTIALALSVLWNFTINRKFTFKSAGNVTRAMILAFLFYVPFYPFQTWYVHEVKNALGNTEVAGLLAEATVMLINGVLEFCWQKFFIYRKEADSALAKYDVGIVGEFGEITPDAEAVDGMQLLELMRDGADIENMTDKQMLKRLAAMEKG